MARADADPLLLPSGTEFDSPILGAVLVLTTWGPMHVARYSKAGQTLVHVRESLDWLLERPEMNSRWTLEHFPALLPASNGLGTFWWQSRGFSTACSPKPLIALGGSPAEDRISS